MDNNDTESEHCLIEIKPKRNLPWSTKILTNLLINLLINLLTAISLAQLPHNFSVSSPFRMKRWLNAPLTRLL